MQRFKIRIEYDGTGLAGWQRQNDRVSVQSLLEAAAQKLAGVPTVVTGAGRTDAGVHACAQVAHLNIEKPLTPYNVTQGLNYHLFNHSQQVVVLDAKAVNACFHARFSALARHYRYRITNRRARLALDHVRAWHIPEALDAGAMQEAAQLLVGTYDFTSFRSTDCQAKSPLRTLEKLEVRRKGDDITIETTARSFLHHQVRNMVGSLRKIGNGKWTAEMLQAALDARDRKRGGETAPPEGLYFMHVDYPDE